MSPRASFPDRWRFETRAIHVGSDPDPATGAVTPPIHQAATFAQESPGRHKGYEYSRTGNPTRTALEACMASLEGGKYGLAFASGMAAITTTLYLLEPGQHVLAGSDAYGGTFRLFQQVLARYGLSFSFSDLSDIEALKAGIRPETKLVWVETPTNPLLGIVDLEAAAEVCRDTGALMAVDNTFATPYLQRPLELGADLVVHSTTKYLGGHSDVIGGVVVSSDEAIFESLGFHQNAAGMVPGPFDCWLVLRGLKTLAFRMEAHQRNAALLSEFLVGHPRVAQVYYPGLADHPGHETAARQMRGFGGMLSFEVAGTGEDARRVASRTQVFTLAESLGGVESLIEHPASMTHATLAGSPLAVPQNLIRLSPGIEHPDDLLEDLDLALSRD